MNKHINFPSHSYEVIVTITIQQSDDELLYRSEFLLLKYKRNNQNLSHFLIIELVIFHYSLLKDKYKVLFIQFTKIIKGQNI
ncbi:hypothetical protein AXH21_00740 [Acinetobacter pittii]|nr:hypothetical protein AXH21_00740 [Acinetobacter pittii]